MIWFPGKLLHSNCSTNVFLRSVIWLIIKSEIFLETGGTCQISKLTENVFPKMDLKSSICICHFLPFKSLRGSVFLPSFICDFICNHKYGVCSPYLLCSMTLHCCLRMHLPAKHTFLKNVILKACDVIIVLEKNKMQEMKINMKT